MENEQRGWRTWWEKDLGLMLSAFSHGDSKNGSDVFLRILAEARLRTLAEVEEMVREERSSKKPEERSDGLEIVLLDADNLLSRIEKMKGE